MSETPSDQIELIQNIPQKITEFLEYGRNNSGWNNLLDIGILENDIFILSSSWEEIRVAIKSCDNKRSNLLEQKIESVNDRIDKLEKLSEKIIRILRKEIARWSEFESVKEKRDLGVILKSLDKIDFSQLTQDKKRILDGLVRLLNEFILEYEEWKIFKEKNLEKLNKLLQDIINNNDIIADSRHIQSVSINPGKINKQVRHDTGWGWNSKRSDL